MGMHSLPSCSCVHQALPARPGECRESAAWPGSRGLAPCSPPLPRWKEDRLMGTPDFIHILRIDPDRRAGVGPPLALACRADLRSSARHRA